MNSKTAHPKIRSPQFWCFSLWQNFADICLKMQLFNIGVGAGKFLPVRSIFARKVFVWLLPTNFLLQKSWRTYFGMNSKPKRSSCVFLWMLSAILCPDVRVFCPDFEVFCQNFQQIKTVGRALVPPSPCLLHHGFLTLHTCFFKFHAGCFWIRDNQHYSKTRCISPRNKSWCRPTVVRVAWSRWTKMPYWSRLT